MSFSKRLCVGVLLLFSVCLSSADDSEFSQKLAALTTTKLSEMSAAVEDVANTGKEQALPYLDALLNNQLYFRKSDSKLFRIDTSKDPAIMTEVAVDKKLEGADTSDFKKIIISNSVRTKLREVMARLQLASSDTKLRARAAREMLGAVTESDKPILEEALSKEKNDEVIALLKAAIALPQLDSGTAAQRLAALDNLEGNVEPAVRNRLNQLLEKNADGTFIETDVAVRSRASVVMGTIESKLQRYRLLETIFFGISLGSVLLLAAIGLAITFGVMGVINMAHGELIMLGAYTTYVIQQWLPNQLELSLLLAVPAAFVVAGLVGIAIERGVIRWLYGRALETLLATFGISLVLQQAVRTIFSPLNRQVATPDWMSGSWQINSVFSLTLNRLYIVVFSLIVFALLSLLLKKTSLGLYVRAVSQNRAMAKAMGVRSDWVDALTFGLGSGIAGMAGVALSQLTNVGPNMGQAYIIDSFMVVVFGGVGNLWGTLVGSLALGVANKFLEPASGAVLAKIFVLIFIILFIQKRPRGLFPQKGRSAES
ncbi:MAG: transporter permease [Verrucomicrobiaceae bacterium]|nr:transporter permease [Verrucomicrobiaceae bacterium]